MNIAKSLRIDDRIFRARKAYCEFLKDCFSGSKHLPTRGIKLFVFQKFINQRRKWWNRKFRHNILQCVSKEQQPLTLPVLRRSRARVWVRERCVSSWHYASLQVLKNDSEENLASEYDIGLESNFRIQNKFA